MNSDFYVTRIFIFVSIAVLTYLIVHLLSNGNKKLKGSTRVREANKTIFKRVDHSLQLNNVSLNTNIFMLVCLLQGSLITYIAKSWLDNHFVQNELFVIALLIVVFIISFIFPVAALHVQAEKTKKYRTVELTRFLKFFYFASNIDSFSQSLRTALNHGKYVHTRSELDLFVYNVNNHPDEIGYFNMLSSRYDDNKIHLAISLMYKLINNPTKNTDQLNQFYSIIELLEKENSITVKHANEDTLNFYKMCLILLYCVLPISTIYFVIKDFISLG